MVLERQQHIEWLKLPQQLYFNRGCLEEALKGGNALSGGKRALVVTDKGIVRSGILQRVLNCLHASGLDVEVFSDVHPDPDMECIRHGVEVCKTFEPDIIVCLGGGSPIDAGKYIRVQYEHPGLTLEDASTRFVEIRKRTCVFPDTGSMVKTLIAIPTTSGTGSEVSPFTVENGSLDGLSIHKIKNHTKLYCTIEMYAKKLSIPPPIARWATQQAALNLSQNSTRPLSFHHKIIADQDKILS